MTNKVFGPVPSRRLGRSLGVNHIPPKTCTYSCAYCQVGRTTEMRVERRAFYEPQEIAEQVRNKVKQVQAAGESIDYLTFVPDGEPTLDLHLGREIELLRPLGIPIAVITNASLIGREDVRAELMQADWVSLKLDSTREEVWRRIDRPHRALRLDAIVEGMLAFAAAYTGELVTETMLVAGINDGEAQLEEVAGLLARLKPSKAYLSIPIRPPAATWVRAPGEASIHRAYQVLARQVDRVEYLIGYEGNAFACTGDVREDLLSITAVHPMRADAVDALLRRTGAGWPAVRALIAQDELVEIAYQGHTFYQRKLSH